MSLYAGYICGMGIGPEAKQGFDHSFPGSTLTDVVFGKRAEGPVRLGREVHPLRLFRLRA